MISYIRQENMNRKKWDQCVSTAHNKSVFGLSWFLDAVCDQWHGLVWGDYEIVQAMPTKKKFGLISILYQPFFTRTLSMYSSRPINEHQQKAFFQEIEKRHQKVLMGFPDQVSETNLQATKLMYQYLDLNRQYDTLRPGFSKNATRLINKAGKHGISIQETKTKNVVALFRESAGTQIKELKEKDYVHLQQLMDACMQNGKGLSLGAFNQKKELIASAFFIKDFENIFYLKGGTNSQGRELGGMFLLFDHVIQLFANQPMTLDFGGSNIESIANFYKKFGATDKPYLFLSKNLI